jgi:hypothetical protein
VEETSGICGMYGKKEKKMFGVLVGEPEGKRLLSLLRYRWENIKMGLKETRCGLDSSDTGYEPFVGCLNRAPYDAGNSAL